MPTTADPLTDDRFERVVAELRAAPPRAPEALRERVRAAAVAPAPERAGGSRRFLRLAVPAFAAVLVAVGAVAGFRGVAGSGETATEGAAAGRDKPALTADLEQYDAAAGEATSTVHRAARERAPAPAPFAPAPTGRLQEQQIRLGLRVPDVGALSEGTARAMAIARSLGGYVVAARYDVPAPGGGDSTLVVRVPVGRVQEALARLTELGTIVSQEVRLQDFQPAHDRRADELERLRERVARLERDLAAARTEEERVRLRAQLAAVRRAVQTRLAQQRATEARGRLARVELTLTTRDAVAAPPEDGAIAVLRAAASLVGVLLVWLGAGLIVAGPFLALLLLAVAAVRLRRRAVDARLLERA